MQDRLSYDKRAALCKNNLAKKLFHLIHKKKSNLALSADMITCTEVLVAAEELGPEIIILKIHVDILQDFSSAFTEELQAIAKEHQFFIFEDRKFADIGNTVKQQYKGGIYHIANWADIINAHTLPGPGIIAGLQEIGLEKERGLLLLAQMSSMNNLFDADYISKTVAMAEQYPEFVIGFISQNKLSSDPHWIYLTPGIQFIQGNDSLGQQYITPEQAIIHNGSDVIIVGRGIIHAKNPLLEAKKYREVGWKAYEMAL